MRVLLSILVLGLAAFGPVMATDSDAPSTPTEATTVATPSAPLTWTREMLHGPRVSLQPRLAADALAYCDVVIRSLDLRARVPYDTDDYVCVNGLICPKDATSRCGDTCYAPDRFRCNRSGELEPLPDVNMDLF